VRPNLGTTSRNPTVKSTRANVFSTLRWTTLEKQYVITIPGIWKNPGAVYPIFEDIHIPGLFDDLVITNSGILKNHGMYFMLKFRMNSLMLHCI